MGDEGDYGGLTRGVHFACLLLFRESGVWQIELKVHEGKEQNKRNERTVEGKSRLENGGLGGSREKGRRRGRGRVVRVERIESNGKQASGKKGGG